MKKSQKLIEKAKEHKLEIGIAAGAIGTAVVLGVGYKLGSMIRELQIEANLQGCKDKDLLHFVVPNSEGSYVDFSSVSEWTKAAEEYLKSK